MSSGSRPDTCRPTDGRTKTTKVTGAFRGLSYTPRRHTVTLCTTWLCAAEFCALPFYTKA